MMLSTTSVASPRLDAPRRPWRFCALVPAVLLLAGCGHVIYRAPNYGCGPFDFRKPPPCGVSGETAGTSGEVVAIRYLGAGGLAIQWQGETLLTAPFFSNYGLFQVLLGWISPDEKAIRDGMAGVPPGVGAILAAHSHYDHLGDLPVIARDYAKRARIYVNDSGYKLLEFPFKDRLVSLEASLKNQEADLKKKWVTLRDAANRQLPFRVLAVHSEHAPHLFRYLWGRGQVEEPVRPWSALPIRHLRCGTTLAFVIDLMDGDTVRYRIYYQDSANPPGEGKPPDFVRADGHPYDLAVLCMASHHWVRDQPETILAHLQPRHVLVTHYEDFFHPRGRPVRFVTLLTNRRANSYLRRTQDLLRSHAELPRAELPRGPVGDVCGPSGAEWTMPVLGEEVRFQPGSGDTRSCASGPGME